MGDDSRQRLYEELASIQHDIWSHWQQYVHEKVATRNDDGSLTIPADSVRHWASQIRRPYSELSESEKGSDREQVDRFWHLVDPGVPSPFSISNLNAISKAKRADS